MQQMPPAGAPGTVVCCYKKLGKQADAVQRTAGDSQLEASTAQRLTILTLCGKLDHKQSKLTDSLRHRSAHLSLVGQSQLLVGEAAQAGLDQCQRQGVGRSAACVELGPALGAGCGQSPLLDAQLLSCHCCQLVARLGELPCTCMYTLSCAACLNGAACSNMHCTLALHSCNAQSSCRR